MKDRKGHGSNKKGTGTQGMRLVKTHVAGPHSAKVYNNPDWNEKVVKFFHNGVYQSKADYHTDDLSDAHGTAQHQLERYHTSGGQQMASNSKAAEHLAGGAASPKAAAAPTHDAMVGAHVQDAFKNAAAHGPEHASVGKSLRAAAGLERDKAAGYNEHGSRHGYNPDAVNKAIDAQNRSGRGKIGGKEASAIHRLLKGR